MHALVLYIKQNISFSSKLSPHENFLLALGNVISTMKDKYREEHPSRKQKLHVGSSDLNDDQNTSSDSRAPPQVSEGVSFDKTDNDIDVYDQLLAKIFPEEDVNYYEYEYPPGYRFNPHDYELVAFYLRRKLQGKSLPRNVVHDVHLYLCNPESLTGSKQPFSLTYFAFINYLIFFFFFFVCPFSSYVCVCMRVFIITN